jgi:hypothetical protein
MTIVIGALKAGLNEGGTGVGIVMEKRREVLPVKMARLDHGYACAMAS